MTELYRNPDVELAMIGASPTDRFVRFGGKTYETAVTLSLCSHGGLQPTVRLELRLTDAESRAIAVERLGEYPLSHQIDAHIDATMVAGKLGVPLRAVDADGSWITLADPDTGVVVVPGSLPLWDD